MIIKATLKPVLAAMLLLAAASTAAEAQNQVQNFNFEAETGSWADGEGPPGWALNLGSDDQRGLVEARAFVEQGQNAFRFNRVERGFGASRLEQCLVLAGEPAIQLSAWVRAEEPHPELATRLRMDFYADDNCQDDSANADNEQVQTDIGLSADRAPAGLWVQLNSEIRLASELGADVNSVRLSLRLRDRSDNGDPRHPTRTVWFDRVSTTADVTLIPAAERAALRELYQATAGEQWANALEWMGAEGTECRWQGVQCNDAGDRVERIALPRNRLLGELPESLSAFTGLLPGEGLDLCWNNVLVPEPLQGFVEQHQVGGDPGHCQGLDLLAVGPDLSGSYFQPADRYGEGFMLHMLSAGSALLMWANYNDQGDPIWLIASGRAHDRVLQFEDIYHTHTDDQSIVIERIGRASLAFVDDTQRPGCKSAVMRFHADGEGFGAGDGRELRYLDGLSDCNQGPEILPVLRELEGHWFDSDQSGQGLSFMPIAGNGLWLNWFGYDGDGEQIWQVGGGWPDPDGERITFEPLYSVYGGSFNDFMGPDHLGFEFHQPAELVKVDGQWQFSSSWQGEPLVLRLQRIGAGPDLLASTGNRIDLIMDPADLEELYTRSIWSDERLPGQIRFNGEETVHELTGLRFRGNSSRMLPKKSYNIRFEQPQALLFGSDRMNLNSMYTDPSMMRESLSFEMFRELGLLAPRTRYFDLWINGIYEGTYLHIQRIDEWLLTMNGLNPNGTLVRDQFRGSPDSDVDSSFNHDYEGMDENERLQLIESNFNYRGDPDWSSLLQLIEWVQETPAGPDYASGLHERFHVDELIDWMVLHWLIGDGDSFADDYWLYLDHEDPEARWQVIPWDKDLSFGSHFRPGFFTDNDFFAYEYRVASSSWPNQLLDKMLDTPSLRLQAESRLLELMDDHLTESWFYERIDQLSERLADSIGITVGPQAFSRNADNHHSEPGLQDDQIEAMRDYVKLSFPFIRAQLSGPGDQQNQAETTVISGSDQKFFLTDETGFTMATVQPLEPFSTDASLQIAATERADLVGIDREWQLSVDGGGGLVRFALFYRNEVSPFWGRGNWWTGGAEPVGRQRELQMGLTGPDGSNQILPTRVNPISNKAVVELELSPGVYQLQLTLP